MTLQLQQIRDRAERILQDESNRRWSVTELNDYIFDAQHEFIRLTGFPLTTSSIALTVGIPTYTRPSSLMDFQKARVRNRAIEIPIVSPTMLDEAAQRGFMDRGISWSTSISVSPSQISGSTTSVNQAVSGAIGGFLVNPDWREQQGPIRALVIEHQSHPTVRVFPVPVSSDAIFSPDLITLPTTDVDNVLGTDLIFASDSLVTGAQTDPSIRLEGTLQPLRNSLTNTTSTDTDSPQIGASYHDALIYGCVERANLKENDLRNVQKSSIFRQKFLEYVADARRNEAESPIRRVGGANRQRLKVSRRWI